VVLSLPTLQRLDDAGYALQLVGKAWAADLLQGHGWPVHAYPKTLRERVRLLRRLAAAARAEDAGFDRRLNAVAFPFSFSSALDMRLAGLRALGHAHEGRSWLLSRSVRRTLPGTGPGQAERPHELAVYWELGSALLAQDAPLPDRILLKPSSQHHAQAAALLQQHGVGAGFVVICPFAGGTFAGQDKTWPGFADFVRDELAQTQRPVLVLPGPGEEDDAQRHVASSPHSHVLTGVRLGTYAALLQRAAVMVSNDTGPGHMAAALGTPLVSVLGPSDAAQWRAWGPRVQIVQGRALGPARARRWQPACGPCWPADRGCRPSDRPRRSDGHMQTRCSTSTCCSEADNGAAVRAARSRARTAAAGCASAALVHPLQAGFAGTAPRHPAAGRAR
jgi:heptosyltransferase II